MASNQFFEELLESQILSDDEITQLEADKTEIEDLIRDKFGETPHIQCWWSYAKGTMVKDSYDLDVVCYFPRESEDNPETLEDIYNSVKDLLEESYEIKEKTSAIHIKRKIDGNSGYHIDVVPGRYIDGDDGDVFLHKTHDWSRIQTNIDTHVKNIKDSDRTEVIRLLKLWSIRNSLNIRTFILELFAIKVLEEKNGTIEEEFFWLLENIIDNIEDIQLIDPANTANIVSDLIDTKDKEAMMKLAEKHVTALKDATSEDWKIEVSAWEEVFRDKRLKSFYGSSEWIHISKKPLLGQIAITPNKPWRKD